VKVRPSSAVLTAASVPVTVMVSDLFAPLVTVSPARPFRLSVPWVAVRVTRMAPLPTSGSTMLIWLLLPDEKTSGVSSVALTEAGRRLTGGLSPVPTVTLDVAAGPTTTSSARANWISRVPALGLADTSR
jgi:hypothetical protein